MWMSMFEKGKVKGKRTRNYEIVTSIPKKSDQI